MIAPDDYSMPSWYYRTPSRPMEPPTGLVITKGRNSTRATKDVRQRGQQPPPDSTPRDMKEPRASRKAKPAWLYIDGTFEAFPSVSQARNSLPDHINMDTMAMVSMAAVGCHTFHDGSQIFTAIPKELLNEFNKWKEGAK